jgi:hypothetical protein
MREAVREKRLGACAVRRAWLLCATLLAAGSVATQEWGPPAAIVLPHKVVAGKPASVAVLDAKGALLPGATIEFTGGASVSTDATGRATIVVPELPPEARTGILTAQLPGTAIKATTIVGSLEEDIPEPRLGDVPSIVSATDRFTITGSGFRGEAAGNRVLLGGAEAVVLAASPLALVVVPHPDVRTGSADLRVQVNGRSTPAVTVTVVSLSVSADKDSIARGESALLSVRITGSAQPMDLELRNLTPRIVRLQEEEDEVVRVRTSGGDANTASVPLKGRSNGSFSIAVRLIPLAAGLPNMEAARQKLLEARRLADAGWRGRLDRVIRQMGKNPEDAVRVRNELEKLLALLPQGDMGKRIEEAWRILLNQ